MKLQRLGQIEETIADVGMEHEKNGLKVPTVLMPVYVMNVGAPTPVHKYRNNELDMRQ